MCEVDRVAVCSNAAVYAPSRDASGSATAKLIDTVSSWGLTVSMQEAVGNCTDKSSTLSLPGGQIRT